jgi:hypothetical protein
MRGLKILMSLIIINITMIMKINNMITNQLNQESIYKKFSARKNI